MSHGVRANLPQHRSRLLGDRCSRALLATIEDCADVTGVVGGRRGGVGLDRLGGVAEGFGDDGDGCELGQFVQGAEPGCACAEYVATEPVAQTHGVDVLAREVAAEDPAAVRVGHGLVVTGVRLQVAPRPRGSFRAIAKLPRVTVTSSSVTTTSSQVNATTSSSC